MFWSSVSNKCLHYLCLGLDITSNGHDLAQNVETPTEKKEKDVQCSIQAKDFGMNKKKRESVQWTGGKNMNGIW